MITRTLFEYLNSNEFDRVISESVDSNDLSNTSSNITPLDRDMTAVENHHRSRRGLFDSLELLLKTPSVDWQKQLGSKQIGASFGLTIKNELDIKIG